MTEDTNQPVKSKKIIVKRRVKVVAKNALHQENSGMSDGNSDFVQASSGEAFESADLFESEKGAHGSAIDSSIKSDIHGSESALSGKTDPGKADSEGNEASEKPKKKRGRPAKSAKVENTDVQTADLSGKKGKNSGVTEKEENGKNSGLSVNSPALSGDTADLPVESAEAAGKKAGRGVRQTSKKARTRKGKEASDDAQGLLLADSDGFIQAGDDPAEKTGTSGRYEVAETPDTLQKGEARSDLFGSSLIDGSASGNSGENASEGAVNGASQADNSAFGAGSDAKKTLTGRKPRQRTVQSGKKNDLKKDPFTARKNAKVVNPYKTQIAKKKDGKIQNSDGNVSFASEQMPASQVRDDAREYQYQQDIQETPETSLSQTNERGQDSRYSGYGDRDSQYGKYIKKNFKNPNQKKTYTMEEVSVSEEEYREHLNCRIVVHELSAMPIQNLKLKLAEMTGLTPDDYAEYKKQEIVSEIIRLHIQNGGVVYTVGTLELLQEGYGFLRSPANSYLSGPEDVYVASGIIKYLNLKTGDTVEGSIKDPKDTDKFFAINKIAFVNGEAPIVAKTRVSFDSLIPLYPDKRINLETERTDGDVSMRIINLFCPIGKGQRALITAPPRTGKTILLQQIANAITTNHPEIYLIVLLVDERPEEVTDMRRNVRGEVIASTFDEQASRHVNVAEMVIEKAKRLVEHKKDVVILLDSITRLARAYNQSVPASGKILSGGVDSNALHKPKRFFGAARNIENGGSLTIIASALIETGSRMDEVIFEEFKGTGNSEIVLDRMMAERRLFPAINIKKSGTRREDLLLEPEEANRIWILRNNVLNRLEDYDITSLLVDKMKKTKNNEAFLRSMNTGNIPAV